MIVILYDEVGRVRDYMSGPEASVLATAEESGLFYIEVDDIPSDPSRVYVYAGELRDMPAPPSEGHYWNYSELCWQVDPDANAVLLNNIRARREQLLSACDWTQTQDSPLTTAQIDEWQEYRQQLRDMPATYKDATDPAEITWPTPPA